jgi:uncharacterized Zn finger protein
VFVENNVVAKCSCPDMAGICKHMFLVSRIKMIHYSNRFISSNTLTTELTTSIVPATVPPTANTAEPTNMEEQERFMESLLHDTNERFANTRRRMDQHLQSFQANATGVHDAELIIQKMKELTSLVQRINNPNQRPEKQR